MIKFKDLDPLLHSQLRLAVISLLMNSEAAEFTWIREQTGATAGNLSIQITKLKEAGYIEVEKKFRNNYPQTLCRITSMGREKFTEYVNALKEYLNPDKSRI
ncbi:MAG: transcriptional regulator [Bacteroidetes bacterium GWE2_41_25]|nr:MAG: transcriptional regulator [Bacteroidetes bacterium GWA2_40_15]OFX83553.1 MAG: transcriptional regulator [Bacteroidetes bacterium GWC2_40_22]OFX95482.1 MAG: transcriptional regulator [Bacteroidetes bacterium GWE2_41_25]HBH84427.1 transcriptional regulator [Bacteroidales bacterium]HCU17916.1 transcriptional regulator [Bacteroidales bacterium]